MSAIDYTPGRIQFIGFKVAPPLHDLDEPDALIRLRPVIMGPVLSSGDISVVWHHYGVFGPRYCGWIELGLPVAGTGIDIGRTQIDIGVSQPIGTLPSRQSDKAARLVKALIDSERFFPSLAQRCVVCRCDHVQV